MNYEVKTVKTLRIEQNITLQELVTLTGISERILSLIDRKYYRASPEEVEQIADAFDIDTKELDISYVEAAPGTWGGGTPSNLNG